MTTCEDWRDASAAQVAALLEDEARTYARDLAWDVAESWRGILPARSAGQLPGVICRDRHGRVQGWTCFLLHQGTLQIALFSATSPDATDALVDRILASPDARAAEAWAINVRAGAPGLADALESRGFDVATYAYLSRDVSSLPASDAGPSNRARTLRAADVRRLAQLCEAAYRDDAGVRAFAPMGTPEEWMDYVGGLARGACGAVLHEASFVISDDRSGTLRAAVLSTRLSDDTGHIAQLVVHPYARACGLGYALVGDTLRAMSAMGLQRATLLVSSENEPARRVYDKWGFRQTGEFVAGSALQPRRFTSVAPDAVGASTLR